MYMYIYKYKYIYTYQFNKKIFRFCGICKLGQLPKTVHCNDCDVCILELDHHCPWTGKCIGKDNLKPFYTFLISTLIYMIFNISVCFN